MPMMMLMMVVGRMRMLMVFERLMMFDRLLMFDR